MSKNAKDAKSAKVAKSDEFISDDALGSGEGSYLNIKKQSEAEFRIISMPVEGWIDWVDKKPIRTPMSDGEPEAADDENPPKKFIAVVVIDRSDNTVKIAELTQQSIIKGIKALAANPKWGKPFAYDLNVSKKGEGLQTRYTLTPSPKAALPKELVKAAMEKPCNLEKLFEGEDPWKVEKGEEVTEYFFK